MEASAVGAARPSVAVEGPGKEPQELVDAMEHAQLVDAMGHALRCVGSLGRESIFDRGNGEHFEQSGQAVRRIEI